MSVAGGRSHVSSDDHHMSVTGEEVRSHVWYLGGGSTHVPVHHGTPPPQENDKQTPVKMSVLYDSHHGPQPAKYEQSSFVYSC